MRAETPIAPLAPDAEARERECADLVAELCRSALTGRPAPAVAPCAERIDPGHFAALAGRNRLWSACARGFTVNGLAPPPPLAEAIRAGRRRAMIGNARVIATAKHVLPRLRERSVEAVTMKGPLFHHMLHGDLLFRRSSDLDLLVPRAQFGAARTVLAELGFHADPANAGPWWTSSLGELHLFPRNPGHCVIDLHHRVQQPGCPAPRDVSLFLADPAVVELAGVAMPGLSRLNALLLACLTLAKEAVHRAPSGMHAYDVAAGFLRLEPRESASFWRMASHQRLANTVRFALALAEGALGLPLSPEGGRAGATAPPGEAEPWFDMVFRPHCQGLMRPRRRELLWRMCDGAPAARIVFFACEAGRVTAGELLRRWTTRPSGQLLQRGRIVDPDLC
ncbi:MAG TPA: nucleotidyltransferase family protein [Novosphingobium sp.]|nr:nucleotidyltransferase family protein [Novosphingobium sp.]